MIRTGSLLVFVLSGARLAAAADIDGPLVGPGDGYEVPVEQSAGGVAGYIEGSYGAAVDAPGDIDTDTGNCEVR
jgi:hypothetical protein